MNNLTLQNVQTLTIHSKRILMKFVLNLQEYLCYQASFTKAISSTLASAETYAYFDERTTSFKKRVFAPPQC